MNDVRICSGGGIITHMWGKDKQTVLHYAAAFNKTDFINYLLSLGVDVNVKDASQSTPLHIAGLILSSFMSISLYFIRTHSHSL
jgi:hypothetical protein